MVCSRSKDLILKAALVQRVQAQEQAMAPEQEQVQKAATQARVPVQVQKAATREQVLAQARKAMTRAQVQAQVQKG